MGFRSALERDYQPPPSPAAARRERGAVSSLELEDCRRDHITGMNLLSFGQRSRREAEKILSGAASQVEAKKKKVEAKKTRATKMVVLRGGKLVAVKNP